MNDWSYELQNAVRNGDYDGVKEAIKHGANVNYNDGYVLRWASNNGHLQVVQYLVEQGADIHAKNNGAFMMASAFGHLDIVKYLVEHGADIHVDNEWALRAVSTRGHFLVSDYLVSQGADPQKVVEDEFCSQENKQWAIDFVKARDLANKLTSELSEKPSKADRLVSSINEDAQAPTKQAKSTRQKI